MKYSRKGGELQPTHPNVNLEVSQVPLASQARHWGTWLPPRWHWGWNCTQCTCRQVLRSRACEAYLWVNIGMSWLKFSPFSGVLHMSTPTIKETRVVEYSQFSTWQKSEKKYLTFIFFFTNAFSKQIQLNLHHWGKGSINLNKSSLIWNKYSCW